MLFSENDYKFMYSALQEAQKAFDADEVPIGAVIVHENKIISRGFNQTALLKDSTAHAEIIAITSASAHLQNKFLDNCNLYVTVEPCIMCCGAILLSRINTIYFGSFEPKFGASGSLYNILEEAKYNHRPNVYNGIYASESKSLLENYFKTKRQNNNNYPIG
jgi:tRNA(adenine34) deaminase